MKALRLSEIARMTGGRLHGEDVMVDTVASDTRALPQSGAPLFIALKGERFDAHDALAQYCGTSASPMPTAALVSRSLAIELPQVVVADTEQALAALATALQRERAGNGKVVAITGSNGKTTVKALLAGILQRCGSTHVTPGNRNNEIGLPLAVIDAPDDARFAIYEMGAGKPGDIAWLTAVVRPDVALVNNVAPAHLERMGSLLAIADTKAAVYDALPADGVAVINADDAFAPFFAERAHGRRLLRFGIESSADVQAREIRSDASGSRFMLVTPDGEREVAIALPGRHNVRNALAAATLALGAGAGLDAIASGLSAAQAVPGRLASHRLAGGAQLVDDSYNANPGSLQAAVDLLAAGSGERWLVLGDMRELGDDAQALHAQAGRQAMAAGVTRLYALGPLSAHAASAFGDGARAFESHDALSDALRRDLAASARDGDAPRILVKGSRGSAMERVVAALLDDNGQGEGVDDAA